MTYQGEYLKAIVTLHYILLCTNDRPYCMLACHVTDHVRDVILSTVHTTNM